MVEVKDSSQLISALIENKIEDVTELIFKIIDTEIPVTLQKKLKNIDKLKSWLDSFRPLPPSAVKEMKKIYDVSFTYNSNAIEGNTLTQSETELVLDKGITIGGKQLIEHLEVIGHKEAIDYIEELAKKEILISQREIKDIHNLIMMNIDKMEAGKYRNLDVRSAGTNHIYPVHYKIMDLMESFVSWLNSDEAKKLHPVDYAAQAHYKLASIHPFKDGNGRTSRLLMNLILLKKSYPIAVITNDKRKEYIDSLIYAQEHNEKTDLFLEMVLDAVQKSIIDYLRVISTMSEEKGKGASFYSEMQTVIEKLR